jgi:protein phosphatase-4 regulatory subunit 3
MALGSAPKGFRPQNLTPLRTPLLGALVDYDEDEEDPGPGDEDLLLQSVPSQIPQKATFSLTPEMPTSPLLSHRQIAVPTLQGGPPKRASNDDNDDDGNLFEALVRSRSRPPTPEPGMMAGMSMGPMRPSEKRRRDDDDDEPLERLSKAKKPDLGSQKEGSVIPGRTKPGEDPPKKIKVKFGATSLKVASPSTSPSEKGAKDEDRG